MAIVELIMPKMGESIMEATILRWHKKVGEVVHVDETLLDIATDKVDSEVPSTTSGILKEVLYQVNDVVAIGAVIARIDTEMEATFQTSGYVAPTNNAQPIIAAPIQPVQEVIAETQISQIPYTPQQTYNTSKPNNNRFFSPLVLNIANSEGLALSELERITGTGADGRVSKRDVLQYVADKKAGRVPAFSAPVHTVYVPQQPAAPAFVPPAPQNIVYTQPAPEPVYAKKEAVAPILLPEQEKPETAVYYEELAPMITAAAAPLAQPAKVIESPVTTEPIKAAPIPNFTSTQPVVAPVAHHQTEQSKPLPVFIPQPAPEITAPVTKRTIEPVESKAASTSVTTEIAPAVEELPQPKPEPAVVHQAAKPAIPSIAPIFMQQPAPQIIAAPKIEVPLPKLPDNAGKFSFPAQAIPTGDVEIVEMDRMRKLIAKHMLDSKQTSPHVTSFAEADVTNMVLWRQRVKTDFERREGTKITFTPMFIECIVNVMKRFPLINCSIDGDKVIIKKDFNIGMATALPTGNLIVPVIKAADQLNIVGLSTAVNNLAATARDGKLKPDDTSGGTFTFTNVGTFGTLMGTPIINQPQVAIISVGAIKKRPVVIESESGDTIGIRHMMYLSLSYDHRIVDGSIGSSFLSEVAKAFEQWDIHRQWYSYL